MIRILHMKHLVTEHELQYFENEALHGNTVFNPDNRRLQKEVSESHPFVIRVLDVLAKHGLLRGRQVGGVVAMHSIKGCRQQAWHTDYDTTKSSRKKSIGVLVALQTPTFFETPDRQYKLSSGDIICFEQDVVHAGAAYAENNTRLHVYLDVVGAPRTLDQNTTWLTK